MNRQEHPRGELERGIVRRVGPGQLFEWPGGLGQGEMPNDPYKATPDELYARGKAHFDAGRLAEAGVPVLLHDVTPGADHYFLSHDLDRARRLMAQVAGIVRDRLR